MTVPYYKLTCSVFEEAERLHRDLMEPWSTRVGECIDMAERQAIMREGLAATFRQRYPMPDEYWPKGLQSPVSSVNQEQSETAAAGGA